MREMNYKWLKMSNKLSLRIGIDYKKGTLPNYQYTRLTLGLFVKKCYGTDDVAFGELDEQFIREYMDFGFDP